MFSISTIDSPTCLSLLNIILQLVSTMSEIEDLISRLEIFPSKLRKVVENLSAEQLKLIVVSWTVTQNVHHICDSHLNSYIRIKLALTESNPTIKPYNESAWATLPDYSSDISTSLAIIDGIHKRICIVLRSLSESDLQKSFVHPELSTSQITIAQYLNNFANHGEQHLAHVVSSLKSHGLEVKD